MALWLGENLFDALQVRRLDSWSGRQRIERLQGKHWRIGFECQQQAVGLLGGTMLDAELQLLVVATQIENWSRRGREVWKIRAALDRRVMGGALAGVVDEDDVRYFSHN